jgi:hypothetical protein
MDRTINLAGTLGEITFGSKARVLQKLKDVVGSAQILPLFAFSISEWQINKDLILKKIESTFGHIPLIIRSSSFQEDNAIRSNAGKFLSIKNVSLSNAAESISRVISSYGIYNPEDEVLIQPMLQGVKASGVAFSHDPNTASPYRVINWSENSDTSLVTNGLGGKIYQSAAKSIFSPPKKLVQVFALLEELLELFKGYPIDIEFAITNNNGKDNLWLLQVRPLLVNCNLQSEISQFETLKFIENKINEGFKPHPFLFGNQTVYGVMPDWNPAEIIGIRPRPLALSLYQDLITDSIWAYQRNNYGYRNLRSFPLMPHFFGLPYIDVRVSFNSFIPNDLNAPLAERLVNYYLQRLINEPDLHDKVEFEIVFSCYSLDLPQRLSQIDNKFFSDDEQAEIIQSLRNLTNKLIDPKEKTWIGDFEKLEVLQVRRDLILNSDRDVFDKIYWLLEDCKRYGTLPFAGLARIGFVAIQMLKSLVNTGIFSSEDYDKFVLSVPTISSELNTDRFYLDKMSFLAKYGHLRPGTYDITSPRYDKAPELYFDWNKKTTPPKIKETFEVDSIKLNEIKKILDHNQIYSDPKNFINFIKLGIQYRELSKFYFTKNLSDALELISEVGESLDISRDELSYINISTFYDLYKNASNKKELIMKDIKAGKFRYEETLKISLPPLISSKENIWSYEWPIVSPNFITQKKIMGPVVDYKNRDQLKGAIVCIQSADPGFDWLFSYPIAGLITAWGGCNSHMAIRAGELGLPSVIGAGSYLYKKWSLAEHLSIDCAARKVEIVS